jgi:hypothetical protein
MDPQSLKAKYYRLCCFNLFMCVWIRLASIKECPKSAKKSDHPLIMLLWQSHTDLCIQITFFYPPMPAYGILFRQLCNEIKVFFSYTFGKKHIFQISTIFQINSQFKLYNEQTSETADPDAMLWRYYVWDNSLLAEFYFMYNG